MTKPDPKDLVEALLELQRDEHPFAKPSPDASGAPALTTQPSAMDENVTERWKMLCFIALFLCAYVVWRWAVSL